jgi:hypothetical protein
MIMSKSKLLPLLVEQGFIVSEKLNVSYEAFGRKVMAFVRVANMQERQRLEAFLKAKDITFDPKYWPGAPCAQVRVSYFKAWHWDE